jgi:two-component system sensor histidine kinase UhpB
VQNRIEDERRHIARELHDETGQNVTAIRSLAQSLVHHFRDGDAKARDTSQLIADTAARLYSSMHDLIPSLRPLVLEEATLGDALQEQVAQWRKQYPHVEFTLALDEVPATLGESYRLAACRIAQEAVVNALRHGEPKRIDIAVRGNAHALALEVRDNGKGLPADWQKPGRFGIRGMRERARTLGGDVRVEGLQSGGVRVEADLPLE